MLKLSTVYPCGLNDRLGGEYKEYDTQVLASSKFLPLPRKCNRIFPGSANKNTRCFFSGTFLINLHLNLSSIPIFSRVSIN